MNGQIMRHFWLVLATFLGLAATAMPASAALQYALNCKGNSCNNNYGTVTLVQHGSGIAGDPNNYVTVNVQLAANEVFASTGSGYPITWNIKNNPALSSVTVTSANSSWFTPQNFNPVDHSNPAPNYQRYAASPYTGGTCSWNDGDCFEYAIAGNWNGTNHHENVLVFDVKKSGGLLISDFDSDTNGGYFFSADIGLCTTKTKHGVTTTDCSNTFNVASNDCDPVTVPEPQTLAMAIAGLGLLLMAQRRRKQVGA